MIFKKTTRKTQPDSLGHLVEMLWSASTVVSFNFRFSQGKKKERKNTQNFIGVYSQNNFILTFLFSLQLI